MFFQRLLHPSKLVLFFLPLLSFAALICTFAVQDTQSAPAYLIYSLSAYSLTIWLAAIPRLTKRIKSAIMKSSIMQKASASKITGSFVYGIVILIAIYMLLHGRNLRKKVESVEPLRK